MDRRGASLDAGFDHDGRREQDAAVMIPLALSLRLPQPAVIRHGASRCVPIRWQLTGQSSGVLTLRGVCVKLA